MHCMEVTSHGEQTAPGSAGLPLPLTVTVTLYLNRKNKEWHHPPLGSRSAEWEGLGLLISNPHAVWVLSHDQFVCFGGCVSLVGGGSLFLFLMVGRCPRSALSPCAAGLRAG